MKRFDIMGQPRNHKNRGSIRGESIGSTVALEPVGDSLLKMRWVFTRALGGKDGGVLARFQQAPLVVVLA